MEQQNETTPMTDKDLAIVKHWRSVQARVQRMLVEDEYRKKGETMMEPAKPILPPAYQGRPWTNKLLHSLEAAELHKLLQKFGEKQINFAVAANAAKGVK